ncbi:copper resistance protein B [Allopontixanthobacter sp.]|uniref:copper resistance protein B n=1 Tax=Allopontixanthobacter sp. TaxID=2906452 RepID=UPI003A101395
MRRTAMFALGPLLLASASAMAQHQHQETPAPPPAYDLSAIAKALGSKQPDPAQDPHAGHDMTLTTAEEAPPPQAAQGPRHAADAIWGADAMAASRKALKVENGGMITSVVIIDRLEARIANGQEKYLWDAQGWYGGDLDKLWLKSEGEGDFSGPLESAEVQVLWSHAIGPFFDLQAGARYDLEPTGTAYGVLGVQGLAPYMFEVDAALFLSERGDLTARIEAEYDQRLTQRLILQPRAEIELSAQDVPEQRIGSGLSKAEIGLRLRYEITREFAPYLGVEYEARTGRTADFARLEGEDPDGVVLLVGIKAWF